MGKKIVILNGSPRRNGNTSALVREFTKGAESSGNTVTEFFLDKWIFTAARAASAVTAAKHARAYSRMT